MRRRYPPTPAARADVPLPEPHLHPERQRGANLAGACQRGLVDHLRCEDALGCLGMHADDQRIDHAIPSPAGRDALGLAHRPGTIRRRRDEERAVKVTQAMLTFVAIDDEGRPRPVDV